MEFDTSAAQLVSFSVVLFYVLLVLVKKCYLEKPQTLSYKSLTEILLTTRKFKSRYEMEEFNIFKRKEYIINDVQLSVCVNVDEWW